MASYSKAAVDKQLNIIEYSLNEVLKDIQALRNKDFVSPADLSRVLESEKIVQGKIMALASDIQLLLKPLLPSN